MCSCLKTVIRVKNILGDPGAESGNEGKSKRAGKCGTKKSKERREEPLPSPPFICPWVSEDESENYRKKRWFGCSVVNKASLKEHKFSVYFTWKFSLSLVLSLASTTLAFMDSSWGIGRLYLKKGEKINVSLLLHKLIWSDVTLKVGCRWPINNEILPCGLKLQRYHTCKILKKLDYVLVLL